MAQENEVGDEQLLSLERLARRLSAAEAERDAAHSLSAELALLLQSSGAAGAATVDVAVVGVPAVAADEGAEEKCEDEGDTSWKYERHLGWQLSSKENDRPCIRRSPHKMQQQQNSDAHWQQREPLLSASVLKPTPVSQRKTRRGHDEKFGISGSSFRDDTHATHSRKDDQVGTEAQFETMRSDGPKEINNKTGNEQPSTPCNAPATCLGDLTTPAKVSSNRACIRQAQAESLAQHIELDKLECSVMRVQAHEKMSEDVWRTDRQTTKVQQESMERHLQIAKYNESEQATNVKRLEAELKSSLEELAFEETRIQGIRFLETEHSSELTLAKQEGSSVNKLSEESFAWKQELDTQRAAICELQMEQASASDELADGLKMCSKAEEVHAAELEQLCARHEWLNVGLGVEEELAAELREQVACEENLCTRLSGSLRLKSQWVAQLKKEQDQSMQQQKILRELNAQTAVLKKRANLSETMPTARTGVCNELHLEVPSVAVEAEVAGMLQFATPLLYKWCSSAGVGAQSAFENRCHSDLQAAATDARTAARQIREEISMLGTAVEARFGSQRSTSNNTASFRSARQIVQALRIQSRCQCATEELRLQLKEEGLHLRSRQPQSGRPENEIYHMDNAVQVPSTCNLPDVSPEETTSMSKEVAAASIACVGRISDNQRVTNGSHVAPTYPLTTDERDCQLQCPDVSLRSDSADARLTRGNLISSHCNDSAMDGSSLLSSRLPCAHVAACTTSSSDAESRAIALRADTDGIASNVAPRLAVQASRASSPAPVHPPRGQQWTSTVGPVKAFADLGLRATARPPKAPEQEMRPAPFVSSSAIGMHSSMRSFESSCAASPSKSLLLDCAYPSSLEASPAVPPAATGCHPCSLESSPGATQVAQIEPRLRSSTPRTVGQDTQRAQASEVCGTRWQASTPSSEAVAADGTADARSNAWLAEPSASVTTLVGGRVQSAGSNLGSTLRGEDVATTLHVTGMPLHVAGPTLAPSVHVQALPPNGGDNCYFDSAMRNASRPELQNPSVVTASPIGQTLDGEEPSPPPPPTLGGPASRAMLQGTSQPHFRTVAVAGSTPSFYRAADSSGLAVQSCHTQDRVMWEAVPPYPPHRDDAAGRPALSSVCAPHSLLNPWSMSGCPAYQQLTVGVPLVSSPAVTSSPKGPAISPALVDTVDFHASAVRPWASYTPPPVSLPSAHSSPSQPCPNRHGHGGRTAFNIFRLPPAPAQTVTSSKGATVSQAVAGAACCDGVTTSLVQATASSLHGQAAAPAVFLGAACSDAAALRPQDSSSSPCEVLRRARSRLSDLRRGLERRASSAPPPANASADSN